MRQILLFLLTAALCMPVAAKKSKAPKEKDMGAYLMVYHKDATHGLYMAVSYDGHTFTALNGDRPVIAGDTIAAQKGIRDPHIFRGPDGAFYLAMTDLHTYAQREGYRDTEWERDGKRFGWGNNRGLVLMKSYDLINWSRANIRFDRLDPSLADIGCVWAPETAYDHARGKLMIYFTMRHGNKMNKLYYSYVNDDYNKIETLPEVLFTYPKEGISAIDGDITYTAADSTYHLMYCSHDGTAGIKQATSRDITGPWTYDDAYCDFEKRGCEAPPRIQAHRAGQMDPDVRHIQYQAPQFRLCRDHRLQDVHASRPLRQRTDEARQLPGAETRRGGMADEEGGQAAGEAFRHGRISAGCRQ